MDFNFLEKFPKFLGKMTKGFLKGGSIMVMEKEFVNKYLY